MQGQQSVNYVWLVTKEVITWKYLLPYRIQEVQYKKLQNI